MAGEILLKKISKNQGNVLTIALIFIAIAMIIFLFVIAVFMSHINNILYNIKLDMYSMNRSAILAVNKNRANIDDFSYDKKDYEKEFVKLLKRNYELDDHLMNEKKLIKGIIIEEYEIYEAKQKDGYTGEVLNNRVIHTVLKVKIKPIILKSFLEKIFVFDVHEDVNLNMWNESAR